MSAELIVAFGSFGAMVITWFLLPTDSYQDVKSETEEKKDVVGSIFFRD